MKIPKDKRMNSQSKVAKMANKSSNRKIVDHVPPGEVGGRTGTPIHPSAFNVRPREIPGDFNPDFHGRAASHPTQKNKGRKGSGIRGITKKKA